MKKSMLVIVMIMVMIMSAVTVSATPVMQLDTESIIEPGYFTVSEYMFGGFVRTDEVMIETYDGLETVYETLTVLQFSEPTVIYLPKGGYYQQSGAEADIYRQNLNNINIKPTIILNVSESSMIKLLLSESKRDNKKLSSEISLLNGRVSQLAIIIDSLRTQLVEVMTMYYESVMGR